MHCKRLPTLLGCEALGEHDRSRDTVALWSWSLLAADVRAVLSPAGGAGLRDRHETKGSQEVIVQAQSPFERGLTNFVSASKGLEILVRGCIVPP